VILSLALLFSPSDDPIGVNTSSTRSHKSSLMRILFVVDFQIFMFPSLLDTIISLDTTVSYVPIVSYSLLMLSVLYKCLRQKLV
jgi:hypothetical protein